jgi:membrane fusion protein
MAGAAGSAAEVQRAATRPQLLFRPEVLGQRQAQWLGRIHIARPPSFAWVTGVALVLALALASFATWGEVTRKARLPGLLVPGAGLISVSAPQAGQVAELLVREGQAVQAGQPLMRLKNERLLAQGGDAALLNAQALAQRRASLETERLLLQQQARQRQDAITDRLRSLQAEERQAEAELETNRLRVQLARKSHERFTELGRSGFVSEVQAQQKQEELLDLQLRERNAERSLQALQRDMQALRAESQSNQTSLNTSLAQLERSLASLSQEHTEHEARMGFTINAPQAGRISALTLHPGQAVQAGQTVLSLVPGVADEAVAESQSSAQLQAQLWAPSRTAGFVKAGQTVWLRYAAYPYQKFGMAEGVVQAVSESPVAPQDLPQGQAQALLSAAQSNEPLYRISVQLKSQTLDTYGKPTALKAGLALEADVLQESRKVWEWALEPVLAASVRHGVR